MKQQTHAGGGGAGGGGACSLWNHSSFLLQQLQEQRIQGMLCDCMLVVKGVCFKAHKNVLAAFSSYFRSLFQNTTGQRNDVFHLVIQDVGGIGQVLDYMYTSHLELNQENIQGLQDIAQYLQVPNILSMCNSFPKPCASTVDASQFLPQEQSCMLGYKLPSEIDLLPTETQKSLNYSTDVDQSKQDSRIQGNISIDMVTDMSTASIKQPLHGYKLRNFYSKQYFKQTFHSPSMQSQNQVSVEGAFSNQKTNEAVDPSPVCQESAKQVDQDSSLPTTPGSSLVTPDPLCLPVPRPVRPKKAVYLKKYNYLCSDRTVVQMQMPKSQFAEHSVTDGLQEGAEHSVTDSLQEGAEHSVTDGLQEGAEHSVTDGLQEGAEHCVTDGLQEGAEHSVTDCLQEGAEHSVSDSLQEGAEHSVSEALQEGAEHSHLTGGSDGRVGPETLRDSESVASQQVSTPPAATPVESSDSSRDPPGQTGNKNYCCEICRKTFKHPSNLELHRRSHTGEKPFQCNICGKHFSQSGNLQTHLRRHSGEKPYICELCGKSFAAAGDVQRHIVIHTGKRPHLCDVCGRGFSSFSNLKEHKKTHSTDKEFTCDQCGKSFNMHRKLQKHKIGHTGDRPHSCQTCGRSFGSTGDLRRHVRSHSGEKPYSCEMCGKSFTRSAVLRRHHSIHCKATAGVCADAKETDQAPKSPPRHPAVAVKAARTSDQRFGVRIQQVLTAPPSHVPLEQSSPSTVLELQNTVPSHILAPHAGKGPDLHTHSKNPQHALSIEVSFCPLSGEHGPASSLGKLHSHGTFSASSQSGSASQGTGAVARNTEHIYPMQL